MANAAVAMVNMAFARVNITVAKVTDVNNSLNCHNSMRTCISDGVIFN